MAFGAGMLIGAINAGRDLRHQPGRRRRRGDVRRDPRRPARPARRAVAGRWSSARRRWQAVQGVPADARRAARPARGRDRPPGARPFVVAALALGGAVDLRRHQDAGGARSIVIYAIVGVSLVILTGWTGPDLPRPVRHLRRRRGRRRRCWPSTHGWDFFAVMFTAGLVGAVVAVLVGLPALRIQGLFLAVDDAGVRVHGARASSSSASSSAGCCPRRAPTSSGPLLYGVDRPQDRQRAVRPHHPRRRQVLLAVPRRSSGSRSLLAQSLRKNRSGRILIGARDNGRLVQAFGVNLAAHPPGRLRRLRLHRRARRRAASPTRTRASTPGGFTPGAVAPALRHDRHRRRRLAPRRHPRRRLRGRPPAAARPAARSS